MARYPKGICSLRYQAGKREKAALETLLSECVHIHVLFFTWRVWNADFRSNGLRGTGYYFNRDVVSRDCRRRRIAGKPPLPKRYSGCHAAFGGKWKTSSNICLQRIAQGEAIQLEKMCRRAPRRFQKGTGEREHEVLSPHYSLRCKILLRNGFFYIIDFFVTDKSSLPFFSTRRVRNARHQERLSSE